MTLLQARQVRETHREVWERFKKLAPKGKRKKASKVDKGSTDSPQFELDLGF